VDSSKLASTNRKIVIERQVTNPFNLGDRVRFSPDEHAIGWSWPSFERLRLKPGDIGLVTRIDKDLYLYLDDERGGFHWECFEEVE
jgi:hypothetical protein